MRCFLKLSLLFIVAYFIAANSSGQKKIVIIGSSTAAGVGASSYANSWAGLFTNYVASVNSSNTVVNLAVPSYTTYHVLPTGTSTLSNRPSVDTLHNITAAIALHPDVIILSLTSNDAANNYSLSESQTNFQTIVRTATSSSIPVYTTTTAPRNISEQGRNLLIATKDWINSTYGNSAIDFFSTVANSDATINPIYNSGDDTHFNDAGHKIFFNRVKDKNILQNSVVLPLNTISLKAYKEGSSVMVEWNTSAKTDVERYEVEKSFNEQQFAKVASVAVSNSTVGNYKWIDLNPRAQNFYRLKFIYKIGYTGYSSIVKVSAAKVEETVVVYPNPVQNNSITIKLNNLEKGEYTLKLSNQKGQEMYGKTIYYTGSQLSQPIKVGSAFGRGVYELTLNGAHTHVSKLIVKD
jgi:lysophospholipase L1-like esterase